MTVRDDDRPLPRALALPPHAVSRARGGGARARRLVDARARRGRGRGARGAERGCRLADRARRVGAADARDRAGLGCKSARERKRNTREPFSDLDNTAVREFLQQPTNFIEKLTLFALVSPIVNYSQSTSTSY